MASSERTSVICLPRHCKFAVSCVTAGVRWCISKHGLAPVMLIQMFLSHDLWSFCFFFSSQVLRRLLSSIHLAALERSLSLKPLAKPTDGFSSSSLISVFPISMSLFPSNAFSTYFARIFPSLRFSARHSGCREPVEDPVLIWTEPSQSKHRLSQVKTLTEGMG